MAFLAYSIGGYTMISIQGDIQPQGQELQEITRPGVNGVAFRQQGVRGRPVQLNAVVDVADNTAADAAIAAYTALKGTLVTIQIDDFSYLNYLVLDVGNFVRQPVESPVGGVVGGYRLLRSTWTVQYAGT